MATRTADIPFAALAGAEDAETEAPLLRQVEDVLRALDKAVRAHQLYQGASGSYIPFVEVVREAFATLWHGASSLVLAVEENRLLHEGAEVWKGQARRGDLAELLHRDGMREITFLPGFEVAELEEFITLLSLAQRLRGDQDDLTTLLWERGFKLFRHYSIDALADAVELPHTEPPPVPSLDLDRLHGEMRSVGAGADSDRRGALSGIASDHGFQFQETLHFLDPGELRELERALQRELERDLLGDVLLALFDRLQDGSPERQRRIVSILTEMLPGLIGSGQLAGAVLIQEELAAIAAAEPPSHAAVIGEVRSLFDRLGEPDTVGEMVRVLQELAGEEEVKACAALLRFFPPSALGPLIAAAEEAAQPELRRVLWQMVEQLAVAEPENLLALLSADAAAVAAGAARLVGKLRLVGGASLLARLVQGGHPTVRVAAIEALQALPGTLVLGTLTGVLQDPDREVRLAALRTLTALRYAPARAPLEALLTSPWLRERDRSERIACFEAYGAVAGAPGVPVLQRILHGRDWLRRRKPVELRACAAIGLGRIDDPRARQALAAAAHDADPVVRSAAARSLRGEPR